jgi:dolichyl-phosphate-mannose--protein O-mannosyl transferase
MADSQSVSQYVLVSSLLCGCLTKYCFLFKSLGLEFVLSLWGALSDERPGLSFVSHSLVICLCVHLLFAFLSFTLLPYIYIYIHTHTHTHTPYSTYNIYKASFSPGSVQQNMPYYSLVNDAIAAV